ncbi:leucyl/phenylalanyl-tRNA--protein transferase [Aureimonas populi]|uniref:Leucyl/phenylalanyl-tRNA--protein transferase n=1 Tax=Aureimonas populi TaxID=1701758 RepID=A0ABW5CM41_9HYPH|nr:leucyl/phenylalanyl-tRNA--protein transferase [Aureimonas populi]
MAGSRENEPAITPAILLRAYACGVFPMGESADDPTIHWVEPTLRGVLLPGQFHLPRSLAKTMRKGVFGIRTDTAFPAVVDACAEPAPDRPQTWINAPIRELYLELFRMGHAHSVECWREGRLVGGLYGVSLGGAFFGESMFSRETDASKVALVALWDILMRGGYTLLDTQFLTTHLARFGAVEIERRHYLRLLDDALKREAHFQPAGAGTSESVLHSLSHTS